MIEESATVVSTGDGFAIVETQQRAACGSCQQADGCSTSLLSALFKRRHNQLRVQNPIGAQAGERVIIGLQEQTLLKVSFTAYLLPLASMLLAAIALQRLAERFLLPLGELPAIGGGLLGIIIGLMILRRLAAGRLSAADCQAVILRSAMSRQVPFV